MLNGNESRNFQTILKDFTKNYRWQFNTIFNKCLHVSFKRSRNGYVVQQIDKSKLDDL